MSIGRTEVNCAVIITLVLLPSTPLDQGRSRSRGDYYQLLSLSKWIHNIWAEHSSYSTCIDTSCRCRWCGCVLQKFSNKAHNIVIRSRLRRNSNFEWEFGEKHEESDLNSNQECLLHNGSGLALSKIAVCPALWLVSYEKGGETLNVKAARRTVASFSLQEWWQRVSFRASKSFNLASIDEYIITQHNIRFDITRRVMLLSQSFNLYHTIQHIISSNRLQDHTKVSDLLSISGNKGWQPRAWEGRKEDDASTIKTINIKRGKSNSPFSGNSGMPWLKKSNNLVERRNAAATVNSFLLAAWPTHTRRLIKWYGVNWQIKKERSLLTCSSLLSSAAS